MVDWNDPRIGSQPRGEQHVDVVAQPASLPQTGYDFPYDATLEIDGQRSLATIGLQAFWLGNALAASSILAVLTAYNGYLIWRLFTFLVCLSIFHFLEYWITARFNLPVVRKDSFLLFSNGMAYNIAYLMAIVEILISTALPTYGRWLSSPSSQAVGLGLVLLGQGVRSIAMAQAGKSFNHTPQRLKKDSHKLVTRGLYSVLRHPSYFGFFYWATGTQLLVGNKLCVLGYVVVLWRFFYKRIQAEEVNLVSFFGTDYQQYRAKTRTGIPFIR